MNYFVVQKKAVGLIFFAFFIFCSIISNAQTSYNHAFNPIKGFVDESEKPFRDEICLNGKWQFMPVYETDMAKFVKPASFSWDAVPLKVPSPWNVNSFTNGEGGDFVTYPSYPKAWEKAQMGWMKKEFTLPENWTGKQIKLHFEAIAGFTKIYVNGSMVGENQEIFLPVELDVTPFLKKGTNEVLVGIAKSSLTDIQGKYGRRHYVAGSFWGQHIAGIWQDVSLIAVPELSVSNVFVQPDVKNDTLTFAVSIKNNSKKKQTFTVNASIQRWEKPASTDINLLPVNNGSLKEEVLAFAHAKKVELKAGDSIVVHVSRKINGSLKLWSTEAPNLYGSVITLNANKKTLLDAKYTRFGWRQFALKGLEFTLNGKPILLKGDSWHFMGIPQMTRRYAWAYYQMLKDVNANAVRLHAQPYPSFYLDMADEMGICVLDETGIWASDAGPKVDSETYWQNCNVHLKKMILRDRNHPAVLGWSVCNETFPVATNSMRGTKELIDRHILEVNNWVELTKSLDPTRNWISGDGEEMYPTKLPTVIGHYGSEISMQKWSSRDLPWGIGETGMAYYGTPKQTSVFNGNRAYESQLGRMEGLANEAYQHITRQFHYKACYASVFNVVWYSLKPLAFGMKDTLREPMAQDGIFFPEFKEGVYGVQPERIGPYTSTLNPGFDPTLPLYKTWPMFEAIQAAFSSPVKEFAKYPKPKPSKIYPTIETDQVILIAGDSSVFAKKLTDIGTQFSKSAVPTVKSLVIIDGANLANDKLLKAMYQKAITVGARIVIWGVSPEALSALNTLLPTTLALEPRRATSFLKLQDAPVLSRLEHSDFYFSELLPRGKTALTYGLTGDLVKNATILLSACNTEWQTWNNRPEPSKTGSVYRSEMQPKNTGNALVSFTQGKSEVLLSSFDFRDMSVESESPIRLMLTNLGVKFDNSVYESKRAVDAAGNVIRFKEEPDGISFWVFSPRSLVDLLAEPNIPKLNLEIKDVVGYNFVLNNDRKAPLKEIPLERGWNKFTIRFKENVAENKQKFKANFTCDQPEFLKLINSMSER